MDIESIIEAIVRRVVREELRGPGTEPASTNVTVLAVDTAEAARRLGGIHPSTVRRWIKQGVLPATRPSGRDYLIRVTDLDALVARQVAPMTPANEAKEGTVAENVARIIGSIGSRR